jgi:hypothetical protein
VALLEDHGPAYTSLYICKLRVSFQCLLLLQGYSKGILTRPTRRQHLIFVFNVAFHNLLKFL